MKSLLPLAITVLAIIGAFALWHKLMAVSRFRLPLVPVFRRGLGGVQAVKP